MNLVLSPHLHLLWPIELKGVSLWTAVYLVLPEILSLSLLKMHRNICSQDIV